MPRYHLSRGEEQEAQRHAEHAEGHSPRARTLSRYALGRFTSSDERERGAEGDSDGSPSDASLDAAGAGGRGPGEPIHHLPDAQDPRIAGANADGAGGGGEDQTMPLNPKRVLCEVFGPVGTVGSISCLDGNTRRQWADLTALPWSFQVIATLPSMCENLVAQGISDIVGCRITVNGERRENKPPTRHRARVVCLVKAA